MDGKTPVICLVEDDPIMGESLCDRFQLEVLAFAWHQTAAGAMAVIGSHSYAVVISDIRLPDLDGGEMYAQLRGTQGKLPPFIFITGYGAIDRAVELLKAGAADYITKPFDLELLIEIVKALISAFTPAAAGTQLGVSQAMRKIEGMLPRLAVHAGTARFLVEFVSGMLNFSTSVDRLPRQVVILEIALAVLVPVLAALPPVWGSARRSPALALSEYGHGHVWGGGRGVVRLLGSLRGLGRLERLALRNPFRNRNRLLIAIVMRSLTGGTFITVLNLQNSLRSTVDSMLSFWQYDFWVAMTQPYRVERLQAEALNVAGVTEVEGWGFELTRRVRPDGSEGNPIFLFGAPVDSPMIDPNILEGRWLLPGDEDAIVIGMGLLDVEPDLGIGTTAT